MAHAPLSTLLLGLGLAVSSTVGLVGCDDGDDDGGGDYPSIDAAPPPADAGSPRPQGVALCYTELSRGHAATDAFWAALGAGLPEDRLAVIAGLEAAATEHPLEEQFALLLGLAHLWRLAEPLPAEVGDLNVTLQSATKARSELERAYALCPTDHRIPAWLGPILVRTGRATGDELLVAEGLAVLQQGIDHYPSFVLFSKLLVYADEPATSADYQLALAAVDDNVDYCLSGSPDDPACGNSPQAAHNIEGASVFMGDALAKAGRKADALAAYAGAKTSTTYAAWGWQALLDERIATIDARIASFADADAMNDAASAWQAADQCSICHRQ